MSNICETNIKVTGKEKDLEALKKAITEAGEKAKEEGLEAGWLGNLVSFLGEDPNKVCCAGTIESFQLTDDGLEIYSNDEWGPQLEPFIMLCSQIAPETEITYFATEPGNGLYMTNDPKYRGKERILDTYGDVSGLPECLTPYVNWGFFSEEELRPILMEALGRKRALEFDELVSRAEKKFSISIHELDWCEVDEVN